MVDRRHDKYRSGAALLVTMVILVALSLLGLSTLKTVMGDQQVSGFQAQSRTALHAAEAGLAQVQANMDGVNTPQIVAANLGDASLYPYGMPSYGPDPSVAQPVKDLGAHGAEGMNLRTGGGGPRYKVRYWKLNVQGTGPGGSIARVEAAVGVMSGS